MGIERLKAWKTRDGHHEVAAGVSHQTLHLALVVSLARAAEAVMEQVMGLKLRKDARTHALSAPQDLRHGYPGVVVQDGLRNAPEEGKRGIVAVAEGLRGLGRIGLDERGVAMRQVHDEKMGLLLHAPYHGHSLPEIHLRLPRRMEKRHEHLPPRKPFPLHVVLDDGVAPQKTVFAPQALEDALGGVMLLLGPRLVFQKPGIDEPREPFQLGPANRLCAPVSRRESKPQNLLDGGAMKPESPGCLPDAHPLHMARPPNLGIHFHAVHLPAFRSPRKPGCQTKGIWRYTFAPPRPKKRAALGVQFHSGAYIPGRTKKKSNLSAIAEKTSCFFTFTCL